MNAPKYNRSRVMKMAWSMFRNGKKIGRRVLTFAECLKEAWKSERIAYNKAMSMYNLWNLAAKQEKERDAKCRNLFNGVRFWHFGKLLRKQQI